MIKSATSAIRKPSLWLIIMLAGLPQFSETIYTPSLPNIAHSLVVSESMVEYTLTIFLFGMALGSLFWGNISDRLGRRPCVIAGLILFIIGCIGCYLSTSIEALLVSRLVQAFGGSIGSVLGQTISRDSFVGAELSRAYAIVMSALAIFPAIGPIIGGMIAQNYGWSHIFSFLTLLGIVVAFVSIYYLPETLQFEHRKFVSIPEIAIKLITDRKVIAYGILVGLQNGINFSFYSEGSFYLIEMLGLSPVLYGTSFILIAGSAFCASLISKKLNSKYEANIVIKYGIIIICCGGGLLSLCALVGLSKNIMIPLTIFAQMLNVFGGVLVASNSLAKALENYKYCAGTASSLFGFFYYCVISAITFGMGLLHNGTLLPMPLYFMGIGLLMALILATLLKQKPYKVS